MIWLCYTQWKFMTKRGGISLCHSLFFWLWSYHFHWKNHFCFCRKCFGTREKRMKLLFSLFCRLDFWRKWIDFAVFHLEAFSVWPRFPVFFLLTLIWLDLNPFLWRDFVHPISLLNAKSSPIIILDASNYFLKSLQEWTNQ